MKSVELTDDEVGLRIARGRHQKRWRRILRHVIVLLLAALALTWLAVWQRNASRRSRAVHELELYVAELQEAYDEHRQLPLLYEPSGGTASALRVTYAEADTIRHLANASSSQVIVAHTGPIRLVLRSDIVVVALKKADTLSVETWPKDRFQREWSDQEARTAAATTLGP